jgi:ribosomal-protein-alanine N-acetyltransferase
MKELETNRLILRRFRVADAEDMYQNYANDPDVTRYLTWAPHVSPEATKQYLETVVSAYDSEDTYQWAIVLRETGKVIGSIAVVRMLSEVKGCELGYCIGKKWWHMGIAAEALREVLIYLLGEGFERIEACHDTENENSGKVMQKAGMHFEGIERKSRVNNRGTVDVAIYSLIPEDIRSDQ